MKKHNSLKNREEESSETGGDKSFLFKERLCNKEGGSAAQTRVLQQGAVPHEACPSLQIIHLHTVMPLSANDVEMNLQKNELVRGE